MITKKLNWADYLYDVEDRGDYVVLHADVPATVEKIGEDHYNYRGKHFDCFYPDYHEGHELSEDEQSYTYTKEAWQRTWEKNSTNGTYPFGWVE